MSNIISALLDRVINIELRLSKLETQEGNSGGVTEHGLLSGLADDDHLQYALRSGRTGGQTLIGGVAANDDLVLEGTSSATKTSSYVILQPNGGDVGIGTTSPIGALDVRGNSTDRYSLYVYNDVTDATGIRQAVGRETRISNTVAGPHYLFGCQFGAIVDSDASANLTAIGGVIGLQGIAGTRSNSNSFTIADVRALDGFLQANSTTAVITNAYAAYLRNKVGSGAITNLYGLYIENITGGATLNYSLYAAGGTAYFGGNIGIGATSPSGRLDVNQASTTAAIPTLVLNQADLSEEFIEFDATVGAGNPIDTAALGTYYGKVRVSVNGTFKFLALYNS